MTREEAIYYSQAYESTSGTPAKKLIDEIFDSFESRTCENCKHQEVEQHDIEYFHKWCSIHCTSKINEEMEDFYCSRHEEREG